MKNKLLDLLYGYLSDVYSLEMVSDWIAIHAFEASSDATDLIDQVDVELIYIQEGVSDERLFRERLIEIMAPTLSISFRDEGSAEVGESISASDAVTIIVRSDLAPTTDLRLVLDFA